MSDVKPLTREEEAGLRDEAFRYRWDGVRRLFAALDAERARADAAEAVQIEAANIAARDAYERGVLEGVKAGIEAAAKASGKGMARANIYALDPAAIARQVREVKRDA